MEHMPHRNRTRLTHPKMFRAQAMRKAVTAGDVALVGELLGRYWSQKKMMAPDAEPPVVSLPSPQ
jgi:galactokinase/mevalonate kinase-like predicted kinase